MNTCRPSGGKDRHLKVNTSKGPRDRRIRLSVSAAIQLYDIQDRLGYNQPSKAVEWLIKNAQHAISELKPLPFIAADREIATEAYQSIAEPSREASVDDQFPRSKPVLDVYSNAGGLLLLKESYDSRFMESTLRTFHHVSNARRHDFDDQTGTRDEESERAKSLERRYSESMPGCSMSEACEERDARCLTVKMDSRFQARERAKERAKVKSLFRTTGQKHITNNRFMPSEIALQSILTDNTASRSLNSSPSFQSSQSAQYPMFPAQATPPDPSLNSTQFLKQNTAGNISLEFPHRFAPPSQPQNVNEMLLQSSVDPTRLQLRPTANDILLGSLQPVLSSTSRTNLHETPFSLSYFPAPAVYQYLSTSGHPLFHAVAMSQLSALGLSNYSQQEVFCHSQAYRPPEFPPASMILPNAPTNILHGNSTHSSWQGWPQTFGQVLSTDSSSTRSTRTLLSQEIRPNDPDPAVQYFSDMARSLSPPPTSSLNRQDFIEREKLHVMSSGRGTFRSLIEGTETMEGVFNSEEHSPSSV